MHPPPPVVRRGVFRGSDVLRRGVLTRGQLRTSAYRRLRPDVYVLTTVPVTHRLHAEAAALVAPPAAAFGGHTAATLWGGRDFAGPDDPVEVVLPPGIRWHASGVQVRTAPLTGAVVSDGSLRWTDRTRTALDLIRRGSLDDAWSGSTGSCTPGSATSPLSGRRPQPSLDAGAAARLVKRPGSPTVWPSRRRNHGCAC